MLLIDEQVTKLMMINNEVITTEKTEHYKMLAPIYFDVAVEYCNNPAITIDNALVFIAKAIQYYSNKAGLVSRSMGTVSYAYTTDLPTSVLLLLKPYKKLRW